MIEKNDIIYVLRGKLEGRPLSLDMSEIYSAESRIPEIRHVTAVSLPDLAAEFNQAYRVLVKHLAAVQYEVLSAEKTYEDAKAVLLLDKYPELMESKGFKDSADTRKACIAQDKECSLALDKLNQLKAVETLLDGKIKVFISANSIIKKIVENQDKMSFVPPQVTAKIEELEKVFRK